MEGEGRVGRKQKEGGEERRVLQVEERIRVKRAQLRAKVELVEGRQSELLNETAALT